MDVQTPQRRAETHQVRGGSIFTGHRWRPLVQQRNQCEGIRNKVHPATQCPMSIYDAKPMIRLTGLKLIAGGSSTNCCRSPSMSSSSSSSSLSEPLRTRPRRPNMLTTRSEVVVCGLNVEGARSDRDSPERAWAMSTSSSMLNNSRMYLRTGKRYRCVEMMCIALKRAEGEENTWLYSGRDFILESLVSLSGR